MLYNTGTIAINGNTATGTGTNWTAPASQVRAGQTIIVMSNPVQLFQISSVNSATSMTVTPAASPALSGQKYGILVSDNISVDGLAQAMSQLIKEYDENIGAWETFATTSANQTITVTINGTTVTIPGIGKLAQKGSNGAVTVADGGTGANTASGARTKLGLGSAATQNVGLDAGDVMGVGGFGIGRPNGVIRVYNINNVTDLANSLREYGLVPFRSEKNIPGTWGIYNYAPSLFLQTVDTLAILSLPFNSESPVRILGGGSDGIKTARTLWDDINTTVDSNGFIKRASPVVKIYADGTAEMNDESEGCKVSRISAGNYLISGCNGLNADAAWGGIDGGFEIPLDKNKQARIWLDYEVNPDGSVLVKTYHRTHHDAPEFARNLIGVRNDDGTFTETTKNGYPIDIPADSFVSVRVEMPEDSIWNQKKEETREAFEKAEYKRQQNQQDAQE